MLRNLFSTAILMAPCFTIWAQEPPQEESKNTPVFSGSLDVYYRYNFSNPPPASSFLNTYTSFTNSQNSFELGMASLKLEHHIGKTGFVADVGFGKRAEEFSYNDEATRLALKQAFITYAPTNHLTLTAGTWATHIGYELADAADNRNYSMSYLFSYGPFSHTGIKADMQLGKSGLMIGIANPADRKSADFSPKTFIAQYSYGSEDAVKLYLNFHGGRLSDSLKMEEFDLTSTTTLSENFSLGCNASILLSKSKQNGKFGSFSNWWGAAVYLNYDLSKNLGFTLRPEYFDDSRGISGAALQAQIFATTLSAQVKIAGLTLIPELRFDKASAPVFIDHEGNEIAQTTTAIVAAVYKF